MSVGGVLLLASSLVATCNSLNIVQTAQASPVHSILVEALTKAGLVDTLSGTGPFTVFAPTDGAFKKFAPEAMKKYKNKTDAAYYDEAKMLVNTKAEVLARKDLADILKYHVLSGKLMSSEVKASQTPTTLQGQKAIVFKQDDELSFGTASTLLVQKKRSTCTTPGVGLGCFNSGYSTQLFATTEDLKKDTACDNGVIHSIDAVLLPPSLNIVQTLQALTPVKGSMAKCGTDCLSELGKSVVKAGLLDTLSGTGPFTLFAPYVSYPKHAVLRARSDLADILKYHVLTGHIMVADVNGKSLATMQGGKATITKNVIDEDLLMYGPGIKDSDGNVMDATIKEASYPQYHPQYLCSNGFIYVLSELDKVVYPPASGSSSKPVASGNSSKPSASGNSSKAGASLSSGSSSKHGVAGVAISMMMLTALA